MQGHILGGPLKTGSPHTGKHTRHEPHKRVHDTEPTLGWDVKEDEQCGC